MVWNDSSIGGPIHSLTRSAGVGGFPSSASTVAMRGRMPAEASAIVPSTSHRTHEYCWIPIPSP